MCACVLARATYIFAEARAQRCPGSEDGDGSRDKPSIESPHQPLGRTAVPPDAHLDRAVTGNTASPQSCATEMERYGESC
ncbi:unnamed protein product [Arctogadus glacialis]